MNASPDAVHDGVRDPAGSPGVRGVRAVGTLHTAGKGVVGVGGFSLIEVMAAVLILGVGLVGLTEGLATALKSTKESEVRTAAVIYAEGLLETLRAEGYVTDGESEGECAGSLDAYRWRRTISASDVEGLHDVSVAIEEPKTGKPVFELRTLLFEVPRDTVIKDRDKEKERDAAARRREGGGRRSP